MQTAFENRFDLFLSMLPTPKHNLFVACLHDGPAERDHLDQVVHVDGVDGVAGRDLAATPRREAATVRVDDARRATVALGVLQGDTAVTVGNSVVHQCDVLLEAAGVFEKTF